MTITKGLLTPAPTIEIAAAILAAQPKSGSTGSGPSGALTRIASANSISNFTSKEINSDNAGKDFCCFFAYTFSSMLTTVSRLEG